jgi:membrane-associated HD superfamily phosphohydrolase
VSSRRFVSSWGRRSCAAGCCGLVDVCLSCPCARVRGVESGGALLLIIIYYLFIYYSSDSTLLTSATRSSFRFTSLHFTSVSQYFVRPSFNVSVSSLLVSSCLLRVSTSVSTSHPRTQFSCSCPCVSLFLSPSLIVESLAVRRRLLFVRSFVRASLDPSRPVRLLRA